MPRSPSPRTHRSDGRTTHRAAPRGKAARPATAPRRRAAPRRAAGRGGSVAGRLGVFLCVLGLLLGLYTAYSVWGTDYFANRKAQSNSADLRAQWKQEGTTAKGRTPPPGSAIGFLYVPRMSRDPVLIKPGTAKSVLDKGVAGVYTDAARPWDTTGNFALAAHRDGHGAKFHNMDRIRPGDTAVVETRDTWYVYTMDKVLPKTSIDNTGILQAVPKGSGYSGPGRYITLTTCTPKYTSKFRMAVWGHLVRTMPVDPAGTLPTELR
ncbi:class E sortase [Streptomyces sp. NBC_01264]|uniref:class E sortase n=1 Tax=Streptomyces sp. NBC_01264 TaxID=2903804 RepID=UPI00225893C5|nr:class E sortase [Streptomyces sp. NBC_01264]MCX4781795.1 class E sortase [Streptomyces sp. NBC_01264]